MLICFLADCAEVFYDVLIPCESRKVYMFHVVNCTLLSATRWLGTNFHANMSFKNEVI